MLSNFTWGHGKIKVTQNVFKICRQIAYITKILSLYKLHVFVWVRWLQSQTIADICHTYILHLLFYNLVCFHNTSAITVEVSKRYYFQCSIGVVVDVVVVGKRVKLMFRQNIKPGRPSSSQPDNPLPCIILLQVIASLWLMTCYTS